MNSNIDRYLTCVNSAAAEALVSGSASLASILPCLVCRELEVPSNQFVDSSDPFMVSFRALRRMQRLIRPAIPRKIEFGSAVYLKEGVIDCIFPSAPVTLFFVGDGNSDKRFAYNCHRLFNTFPEPYKTHSFIYNPELEGGQFGSQEVTKGWDAEQRFYHAGSWNELPVLSELIEERYESGRIILVVDLDGTLLCPRPTQSGNIKAARRKAIVRLSESLFTDSLFSSKVPHEVQRLEDSYGFASKTGFSKAYDDEDLTMLIALGLYAGIITPDDELLNPKNNVGFVNPIEYLQYAAFSVANDIANERKFRQLHSLFVRCMDSLQSGSPTAFLEFRREEEKVLLQGAKSGEVNLNRSVIEFIQAATKLQAVPIGFSDRPNASLGFSTTPSPAVTMSAGEDSLYHAPMNLV